MTVSTKKQSKKNTIKSEMEVAVESRLFSTKMVRALEDFCETHKIKIPHSDHEFNLLNFLVSITDKATKLSKAAKEVDEAIQKLMAISKDIEEDGVMDYAQECPNCGSDVLIEYSECHVCGENLFTSDVMPLNEDDLKFKEEMVKAKSHVVTKSDYIEHETVEMELDNDDDFFEEEKPKKKETPAPKKTVKVKAIEEDFEDEEDEPAPKKSSKKVIEEDEDDFDFDDEEDEPAPKKSSKKVVEEDDLDDEEDEDEDWEKMLEDFDSDEDEDEDEPAPKKSSKKVVEEDEDDDEEEDDDFDFDFDDEEEDSDDEDDLDDEEEPAPKKSSTKLNLKVKNIDDVVIVDKKKKPTEDEKSKKLSDLLGKIKKNPKYLNDLKRTDLTFIGLRLKFNGTLSMKKEELHKAILNHISEN
jgi:ribosomal protein S27AE